MHGPAAKMRPVQRAARVQKRFFNVPVTLTTSHEFVGHAPTSAACSGLQKILTMFLLEVPTAGPSLHSGGPQKLNLFRAG